MEFSNLFSNLFGTNAQNFIRICLHLRFLLYNVYRGLLFSGQCLYDGTLASALGTPIGECCTPVGAIAGAAPARVVSTATT